MPPRMSQLAVCATKMSCVAAVITGTPARIVSHCQTSYEAAVACRSSSALAVSDGRARRDDDVARAGQAEHRQRPEASAARRALGPRRTRRRLRALRRARRRRARAVSSKRRPSATFERSTYIESRFATDWRDVARQQDQEALGAATDRATRTKFASIRPFGELKLAYRQAFAGSSTISAESWPFRNCAASGPLTASTRNGPRSQATARVARCEQARRSATGESVSGSEDMLVSGARWGRGSGNRRRPADIAARVNSC